MACRLPISQIAAKCVCFRHAQPKTMFKLIDLAFQYTHTTNTLIHLNPSSLLFCWVDFYKFKISSNEMNRCRQSEFLFKDLFPNCTDQMVC